jgi:hypothetical protein
MTTTTETITAVPCPLWCSIDHTGVPAGAGFHRSLSQRGVCLWLTDQEGAQPCVLVGGEGLTPDEADALAAALESAAGALRLCEDAGA